VDHSGARRHRRYPVKWGVELSASSWEEVLQLSTDNVSRGGLFVQSQQTVEAGSRLRVTLKLPDGSRMEVEGVVVHATRPGDTKVVGFGVRFDDKHAIDLDMLEATAASHAGGRNVYQLEQRHLVLPALVRSLDTGNLESTRAYQLGEGGSPAVPQSAPVARAADSMPPPAPTGSSPGHASPPAPVPTGPASTLRMGSSARRSSAKRASAPGEHITFDTGERPAVSQPQAPPPNGAARPQAPPAPAQRKTKDPVGKAPIFGIDFGTTYSSIALVSGEGIRVLEDPDGNAMIPSVVSYPTPDGQPVVGWPAREMVPLQRENTFLSPKRLLGRSYDDRRIQPFLASSPVRTQQGPNGQVLASVHGHLLALPQVCAEIFRELVRIGEQASGEPVQRAVLSTPVGYTPIERAAIERSAKLAGIQVMAVIEEPVAAAMAYGLGRADGELIAIYDFGGGTFDCTLLEIKNQRFNLLGSGGDAWLGGDDFDLAMAEHAANDFWKKHEIDLRKRAVEWQRLVLLCERVKRKLTTDKRVELRARSIVSTANGPLDLGVRFDRQLFAELCGGLVERSVSEMDVCISGAGVKPTELHHVVLTGGVSRIPLVRQHLQHYYQREIQLAVNPEQAIVVGNAIYARFLQLTGGKQMPI
jgi:actin-like ATPase involved in cell morphogenesis